MITLKKIKITSKRSIKYYFIRFNSSPTTTTNMNIKKITNCDLRRNLLKIPVKFALIKKALNDKDISLYKKQLKIERLCVESKKMEIDSDIYRIYPRFSGMINDIKMNKSIIRSPVLNKLLSYIGNKNIPNFTIHVINNIINDKFKDNSIDYTYAITTLSDEIYAQCKVKNFKLYKKGEELFKNNITKTVENQKAIDLFETIEDLNARLKFATILLDFCENSGILKTNILKIKRKSKKNIKFNKNFMLRSYKSHVNLTDLPMVVPPSNWKLNLKDKIVKGGYLLNKKDHDIKFMRYGQEASCKSHLKQPYIDIINKLQGLSYEIDEKQSIYYLKNFIDKVPKQEQELMITKDFETFFLNNRKNTDILKDEKNEKQERDELFLVYKKKITKLTVYFETLYIASLYRKFTIFFVIFNDFRNRLYYNSYPLNLQGNKLARCLLTFKKIRHKKLISLDATASGIQILSSLLRNEVGLKMTNLLGINSQDIYLYYRNMFNNSPLNYIPDTKTLKVKATKKEFTVTMKQNKLVFKDRSLFKSLLMTYPYNKSVDGMVKSCLNSNEFPGTCETELFYHMTNLLNFFKQEFYYVEEFKKLIKDIIRLSKNESLILTNNSNLITVQLYPKQFKKIYRFRINNKQRHMTLKHNVLPLKKNKRKSFDATMANIVHNLDAQVLYGMAQKCIAQKIPVCLIHDCFIIPEKNEKEIRSMYLEQMQKIVNPNILIDLILNNITEKSNQDFLFNKYLNLIYKKVINLNNKNGLKEEKIEFKYGKKL